MENDSPPKGPLFSVADAKSMFQRLFFLTDQRVQRQLAQTPKMLGEFALEVGASDDVYGIHQGTLMSVICPWRADVKRLILWIDNPSASVTVSMYKYAHMSQAPRAVSFQSYITVGGELDLEDVSISEDEHSDGSQAIVDATGYELSATGFFPALEAGDKIFVRVDHVDPALVIPGQPAFFRLPKTIGAMFLCRLRSYQATTTENSIGSRLGLLP